MLKNEVLPLDLRFLIVTLYVLRMRTLGFSWHPERRRSFSTSVAARCSHGMRELTEQLTSHVLPRKTHALHFLCTSFLLDETWAWWWRLGQPSSAKREGCGLRIDRAARYEFRPLTLSNYCVSSGLLTPRLCATEKHTFPCLSCYFFWFFVTTTKTVSCLIFLFTQILANINSINKYCDRNFNQIIH